MTVALLEGPTPIHHAPLLAAALGLDPDRFWIKRDDLIGLGGGGNKIRKLQHTLVEAQQAGADTLVTTGAAQSNHARLTAAAGARLGLDVVLVLSGPATSPIGNVLLEELLGATVLWSGDGAAEDLADDVVRRLARSGKRPHRIPFGGSTSASAQGYVDAAAEITTQVGDVDHLVTAVGSGGTMAGLVSHLGAGRVLGVHCGAVDDPRATVAALLKGMPTPSVDPRDLRLDLDQVGDGYEHLTPGARDALLLFARLEGVVLDPTYTARAAAGLIAAIRDGSIGAHDRVVFLHSGGSPSLFAHPELASWAAESATARP
jgi:1-aminocyclopropane-1-carboxylate deaminase/D-cysteine desulfhydrase-like pyridoxal-dependent ACC family enzyme